MANLSDQFNINVVQGLVLPRDSLSQNVINEPGEVNVLGIFLIIDLFTLLLVLQSILFGLRDD